jgi:serine/threonine protein kinase
MRDHPNIAKVFDAGATDHRDIKPSNILVTEQDGAPMPKIIDFGIAKPRPTSG